MYDNMSIIMESSSLYLDVMNESAKEDGRFSVKKIKEFIERMILIVSNFIKSMVYRINELMGRNKKIIAQYIENLDAIKKYISSANSDVLVKIPAFSIDGETIIFKKVSKISSELNNEDNLESKLTKLFTDVLKEFNPFSIKQDVINIENMMKVTTEMVPLNTIDADDIIKMEKSASINVSKFSNDMKKIESLLKRLKNDPAVTDKQLKYISKQLNKVVRIKTTNLNTKLTIKGSMLNLMRKLNKVTNKDIKNDEPIKESSFDNQQVDNNLDKKITEETHPKGFLLNDVWNPIQWINGLAFRNRVDVLVINDENKVFVRKYDKDNYRLPGGGIEEILSIEETAIKETEEEAGLKIKDVYDTQLSYIKKYTKLTDKLQLIKDQLGFEYFGVINRVVRGTLDKDFVGHIDDHDKDNDLIKNGKFINMDEVNFNDVHKMALSDINKTFGKLLETIIQESIVDTTDNKIEKPFLYHVSTDNHGSTVSFSPRVPNTYMIQKGLEDNKTPRICFSHTILGALKGINGDLKGKKFHIYTTINTPSLEVFIPSNDQVPDAQDIGEVWVLNDADLMKIGMIEVTDYELVEVSKDSGNISRDNYDYKFIKETNLEYFNKTDLMSYKKLKLDEKMR